MQTLTPQEEGACVGTEMSGGQPLPSCRTSNLNPSRLTSRRSQPPLALAVPLSRFPSRVGRGSAFYVRRLRFYEMANPVIAVKAFHINRPSILRCRIIQPRLEPGTRRL